jgi:hypothetical protein
MLDARPHQYRPGTPGGLDRATWERAMNRLRTISRLLGFCLATVIARMMIDGPALASGLTAALILALLLATLRLEARGRRVRPAPSPNTTHARPTAVTSDEL